MSTGRGSRVLGIGIDAAEATFVKQLIEQNEMPALKSLLREGQWLQVESPADIGSGAVWPTFMTGEEPLVHGVYGEWSWCSETMSLSRYQGRHLTAFWETLARQSVSTGIFDVPFALPVGLANGFEVCEWWAHDSTGAGLQGGPEEILQIVRKFPAHPLSANRFVNTTPDSQKNLIELTSACVEGVRLRGALAQSLILKAQPRFSLIVFPEVHHAGHQMWHTLEPHNQIYQGKELNQGHESEPLLKEIYRAVDQQIGALVDSAGNGTSILVFALHGMRAASGFPTFLAPLLCERGFSRLANWRSKSWRGRALSLLATTKRHTPVAFKELYYKLMPTATTHKLARPTMLPAYDWENTRAFSLPTDQHGWIRVNLGGREAQGIVSAGEYEKTCDELEARLLALTTESGASLVRDIVRTAVDVQSALNNPLPDLVVHWEDAAFASPLRIKDSKVRPEPMGKKYTGQHAPEGFCIYRGKADWNHRDVIAAKDLGRLITASL